MPRKLRIAYAGAIYHVMSRGDRREKIFRGKQDREMFLSALVEACEKTGRNSYGQYLKEPKQRPPWLRVDRVLGEAGIPSDTEAGRKEYAQRMELRRAEKEPEDYDRLVAEGLKILRWDEEELALRRKGDKEKVKLARQLRAQTTTCRQAGR